MCRARPSRTDAVQAGLWAVGFQAVAGKGARWEVARTFAALLQLVNERKVAVRSAQQGAPVGLCSALWKRPHLAAQLASCLQAQAEGPASCLSASCCH